MDVVLDEATKRKILSLKKEPKHEKGSDNTPPRFLRASLSVYMVWSPDSDMPKKVYGADEQDKACAHAQVLARKTGQTFYVMRSWRGYEGKDAE